MVLEKTLESPLDCKEIQPVHPKGDQSWVFFGRTDVEAAIPILWQPDAKCWLIWKGPDAGRKIAGGADRAWDDWLASPTQWTWVWVNSRSWWWTGSSGVLLSMGSQRVGHDWVTELNLLNVTVPRVARTQVKCITNSCCLVIKSCQTLCNPMDCRPPGSCPWDFPGKNTVMGCHFLLQGIFLTQASKAHLLHGRRVLYHWATREVILTVECTSKGFSLKYLVLNLQKWQSIRKVKCFWWVGKCFPSSCGHWRRWKENMFMVGRLLEHKHWTE